jgi:methionine biosynthesis protein MetW
MSALPADRHDRPRTATPRVEPHHTDANGLRPDLAVIAGWIPPGSRVLDLGCGDGVLLDHLQRVKGCAGYGVEIDDTQVLACARRGVDVIQQDVEAGLDVFAGLRFDVVVMSMAIQATHRTERVLREMSGIGDQCIVSFPNFGHWSHAWSILKGRMPMSSEMPYQWYDTPNLHLSTLRDFEDFVAKLGLRVTRSGFLADGRPVGWLPGLRCTQAIYSFRVR